MSFTVQELLVAQLDERKSAMMEYVVQNERLLESITWSYWNPSSAPTKVGRIWSEAMNTAWDELKDLESFSFHPEINEFLVTIEDELDSLVDKFFDWTNREVISAKEAAETYNRSTSTIYRWIKQGKLQAKKVRGRWQIIA